MDANCAIDLTLAPSFNFAIARLTGLLCCHEYTLRGVSLLRRIAAFLPAALETVIDNLKIGLIY